MAELFRRPGSPFWYAYLHDPRVEGGLVRRSTKCANRREARKIADAAQNEIDKVAVVDERAVGLRWLDALAYFLENNSDLKDSTIRNYSSVGPTVFKILGDFDLGVLDHAAIRSYCQERRQQTVKPPGAKDTGRLVSDVRIRVDLSTMSAVYQYVIDRDLLNNPLANPLKTFDRSFLKTSRRVDRHLRPTQFQDVLDACQIDDHRHLLLTLVGTGMRASEVINLYWGEVDLKNEVIEFGNIDPDRTKTARSRRITMLPPVRDALKAQKASQLSIGSFTKDGLVFPSPVTGGRRYDLKYLARIARERANVKGFWVHGLRHTFASWAIQQGLDPETIRLTLGHSTLSTTTRYAHHVSDSVLARLRTFSLPVTAQTTSQSIAFEDAENQKETEKAADTSA